MSNVKPFPGFLVPETQDEPVPNVVEICEELLAMARNGELRGVGVAMVLAGPPLLTKTCLFSRSSPDRYVMIAAVAHLQYRVAQAAWGDDEVE